MAISVPRRKNSNKVSKKTETSCRDLCFFHTFLLRALSRIPLTIFLMILVYIWSSSTTIMSGHHVLHLCVSSRKLNDLYCLSAGTQQHPASASDFPLLPNYTSISNNNSIITTPLNINAAINDISTSKDQEAEEANRVIEQHLRLHRSWSSNETTSSCDGRGVYVYDLPTKFNKNLVGQCGDMIPWENYFCNYFENGGLGKPIEKLGKGWYDTHQYSLEPIFHSRILSHPCRVYNQNEAKLFYVPYYGGLDILRWHFKNVSNDVKDTLGLEVIKWLESQNPWKQNNGKDHVFVLGKISWDFRRRPDSGWGTRFLQLEQMKNPTKLLIERQPWDVNDIGIPHPTYFHPYSDDDILTWQLRAIRSKRRSLVSFAGAARPDQPHNIRSILIKQCVDAADADGGQGQCKFLNCSNGGCDQPKSLVDMFMESEFCLQPPGDSPTRKSVFDSLVSGCIPVLFSPFTAYYQYPWHLPEEHEKYSVFVDEEQVRKMKVNVVERLVRIPARQREEMRRFIVYELLPGLVYGDSSSQLVKFQDSFSITVNNLIERVNRLK
ncbi:Probable xyloglucan galactosyltransferase GT20 [Linum grandiflorum]